jgi:hypothetical protein
MPHDTRILEDFFGHPHRRLLLDPSHQEQS